MSNITKIKDPLYGYIKIVDADIISILNSSAFHRLNDIIQTSYTSVFPASTHTRFTHSLGVYYLGDIAQRALRKSFSSLNVSDIPDCEFSRIEKLFLLACLLHDVGHSPFSHTGEEFYLEDSIWSQLQDTVKNERFSSDSKGLPFGAPHEIMSALASLKFFPTLFTNDEEKAFFSRCIIGLKYTDDSASASIKNCFIELLNSKTIDVDKLDYLLRDSFISGFSTMAIDYHRLLSSVCIVEQGTKDGNRKYALAFNKSALSTLEGVILAHDMERKWIQNHPVIQYENYLVRYIISETVKYYKQRGISIFSLFGLSESGCHQGISLSDFTVFLKQKNRNKNVSKWLDESFTEFAREFFEKNRIALDTQLRLFSDADILSTAKNCLQKNDIIKEYFDRGARKKSFWKSESEYRILFERGAISYDALKQLENRFQAIENGLKMQGKLPVINEEALQFFKSRQSAQDVFPQYKVVEQNELSAIIALLELLKEFADDHSIPFEFVAISAKQFDTGFNKSDFKEIKVNFPNLNRVTPLKDAINTFDAEKPRSNFFYLYAKIHKRQSDMILDLVARLERFASEYYCRS